MKVAYLKDQRDKVTCKHPSCMSSQNGLMSGCVVTKYGVVQVWQWENSDKYTDEWAGYGGMIYVHNGVRWFRQWRKTVLNEKQLTTVADRFACEKFESNT